MTTRSRSIASANSFFDEMMDEREKFTVVDNDAPFGIVTNDKRGFPLQSYMNYLANRGKCYAMFIQVIENQKVEYDAIKENPFVP